MWIFGTEDKYDLLAEPHYEFRLSREEWHFTATDEFWEWWNDNQDAMRGTVIAHSEYGGGGRVQLTHASDLTLFALRWLPVRLSGDEAHLI